MKRHILAISLALAFLAGTAFGQSRFHRMHVLAEASELPAGAPTVSSCGASPSITGTNSNGTITVGSGVVTACTLTFSQTLAAAPVCTVTPSLALAMGLTTTTTAVTMAIITTLGGGSIGYHCRSI